VSTFLPIGDSPTFKGFQLVGCWTDDSLLGVGDGAVLEDFAAMSTSSNDSLLGAFDDSLFKGIEEEVR
jgi:hypothetical protein